MKWYDKYRVAFECAPVDIPSEVREEVKDKMKHFHPEKPLCSVVVIAHNEERHIWGCLWSLVDNQCDFPVELIVVSNNSMDHTDAILEEVGVSWYREERKGPGFARQCGLDKAKGKYHVCIDSDTLYPPYYIATHVKALQTPGIVCTYGLWSFLPDKEHSSLGLWFYEFLRDIYLKIQNVNRPELCVRGMVLAFHTDYGKKIGYRTNIIRGEDGMMSLGLKQYGKLRLLTSRKVRAVTCNTTLNGGGSLLKNFFSRLRKGLRNIRLLFTTQSEYVDQEYNLIDKTKK
ncbi:MAG: glycosyltransferase family 2 protein [Bacteroides sp.]|nr:glycosyltransferase family 2 protein [Bacteroides sp.]